MKLLHGNTYERWDRPWIPNKSTKSCFKRSVSCSSLLHLFTSSWNLFSKILYCCRCCTNSLLLLSSNFRRSLGWSKAPRRVPVCLHIAETGRLPRRFWSTRRLESMFPGLVWKKEISKAAHNSISSLNTNRASKVLVVPCHQIARDYSLCFSPRSSVQICIELCIIHHTACYYITGKVK